MLLKYQQKRNWFTSEVEKQKHIKQKFGQRQKTSGLGIC